jgi:hypothetical protein
VSNVTSGQVRETDLPRHPGTYRAWGEIQVHASHRNTDFSDSF